MVKLTPRALHTVCPMMAPGTEVRDLLASMWFILERSKGVGLAANQVGDTRRVIIIKTPQLEQVFLNPKITKFYGGKMTSHEGCLSFPNVIVPLIRWRQVVIEGFSEDWQPVTRQLKGQNAICAQHEIDHLNGITMLDRAKEVRHASAN